MLLEKKVRPLKPKHQEMPRAQSQLMLEESRQGRSVMLLEKITLGNQKKMLQNLRSRQALPRLPSNELDAVKRRYQTQMMLKKPNLRVQQSGQHELSDSEEDD